MSVAQLQSIQQIELRFLTLADGDIDQILVNNAIGRFATDGTIVLEAGLGAGLGAELDVTLEAGQNAGGRAAMSLLHSADTAASDFAPAPNAVHSGLYGAMILPEHLSAEFYG